MRTSRRLEVSDDDRAQLGRLLRAPTTAQRVALRARIVLLSGEGVGTGEIRARLRTTTPTVTRWRDRYEQDGVRGLLKDAARCGRLPTITKAKVAEVIEKTQGEKPAGATQWSTRTLAPVVGLSPATVGRIWRAHGLKPHRVKRFKLSTDPQFLEKLQDVVGLYVAPPEKAVVFSVDEKSQIQALDRTQPGLLMKKGRAGTMTHDYGGQRLEIERNYGRCQACGWAGFPPRQGPWGRLVWLHATADRGHRPAWLADVVSGSGRSAGRVAQGECLGSDGAAGGRAAGGRAWYP